MGPFANARCGSETLSKRDGNFILVGMKDIALSAGIPGAGSDPLIRNMSSVGVPDPGAAGPECGGVGQVQEGIPEPSSGWMDPGVPMLHHRA